MMGLYIKYISLYTYIGLANKFVKLWRRMHKKTSHFKRGF